MLPVKCRGKGRNSHTALSLHCRTFLRRVCPASFFGCWNQRKVPQDFKIQWITVPFRFWITKKKISVWRSYLQTCSVQEVQSPCAIWWRPWPRTNSQRRGTSLQLVTAMAKVASKAFMPTSALSWMYDEKCGIPPDRQVFQFQFGVISKVYLISVIQHQELHYSQWRSTK